MSIKEKLFLVLAIAAVCMFVLNSCTWSDVPAQECCPPDTTGVESDVVVWDALDVSELTDLTEWGTIDNIADTTLLVIVHDDISTTSEWYYPPYSAAIYEFLELYQEYETECWNDSTSNSGWVVNGYGWQLRDKFVHNEPTIKGFIKYLREK